MSGKTPGGHCPFAGNGNTRERPSHLRGRKPVTAKQCEPCGGRAEPPFESTLSWYAPATVEGTRKFVQGNECEVVRIERPLCRYCAYALSHGADGLTEDGKDGLDLLLGN